MGIAMVAGRFFMNQQLEVFFPEDQLTAEVFPIDARQLHCALQVVTPFKDWVRRRIKEYGFKESLDFQMRKKELASNLDISVKTPKDYAFSIQAAKELAMIERTPKGREIRAYFLECEKKALIDIPILKEKLAQKDQLIETLRASVHTLPAPRKSKGSHMLIPQAQPCFDIEGHLPELRLVPVPITNLTPTQIKEARFQHKLSTMRGLAASIGLQAVFDLFYNDVRMALGR
jgi:phage anti-repressor protein